MILSSDRVSWVDTQNFLIKKTWRGERREEGERGTRTCTLLLREREKGMREFFEFLIQFYPTK